jgi:hypothetical protein
MFGVGARIGTEKVEGTLYQLHSGARNVHRELTVFSAQSDVILTRLTPQQAKDIVKQVRDALGRFEEAVSGAIMNRTQSVTEASNSNLNRKFILLTEAFQSIASELGDIVSRACVVNSNAMTSYSPRLEKWHYLGSYLDRTQSVISFINVCTLGLSSLVLNKLGRLQPEPSQFEDTPLAQGLKILSELRPVATRFSGLADFLDPDSAKFQSLSLANAQSTIDTLASSSAADTVNIIMSDLRTLHRNAANLEQVRDAISSARIREQTQIGIEIAVKKLATDPNSNLDALKSLSAALSEIISQSTDPLASSYSKSETVFLRKFVEKLQGAIQVS